MENNHKCKICQYLMSQCVCKESKNYKPLKSFIRYCIAHPEERFYQALRNWGSFGAIYGGETGREDKGLMDTFYFEGKNR
jgi:hypothetical protein